MDAHQRESNITMAYVVYEKESTRYANTGRGHYTTEAAAKAALTRFLKKNPSHSRDDYDVADHATFSAEIEKTRVVKNLMSGKDVEERVNTPYYCSVASESYWSM